MLYCAAVAEMARGAMSWHEIECVLPLEDGLRISRLWHEKHGVKTRSGRLAANAGSTKARLGAIFRAGN